MKLLHEGSHYKLVIPEARLDDTGQYTVLAHNEAGTRSCSMCRLRVLSAHERPAERTSGSTGFAPVVLEPLHETSEPASAHLLHPNQQYSHQVQHQNQPQLQLQQSSSSGAVQLAASGERERVLLTCAVLASPPPSPLWLFRARPLPFSERLLAEFRPPTRFSLRILEPTAADAGLYSLMLSNKHGDLLCPILIRNS